MVPDKSDHTHLKRCDPAQITLVVATEREAWAHIYMFCVCTETQQETVEKKLCFLDGFYFLFDYLYFLFKIYSSIFFQKIEEIWRQALIKFLMKFFSYSHSGQSRESEVCCFWNSWPEEELQKSFQVIFSFSFEGAEAEMLIPCPLWEHRANSSIYISGPGFQEEKLMAPGVLYLLFPVNSSTKHWEYAEMDLLFMQWSKIAKVR